MDEVAATLDPARTPAGADALALLGAAAPVGLMLAGIDGALTANARARDLVGAETLASLLDVVALESRDTLAAAFASAAGGTGTRITVRRRDGRWLRFAVEAAPGAAWVASVEDVSEPFERYREVERLTALYDHSPDYALVVDPAGLLVHANARTRATLAAASDPDVYDAPLGALLAPASRRRFEVEIWPALTGGATVWQGEVVVAEATETVPVSMSAVARTAPDGSLDAVAVTLRDLRPLKEVEAQLRYVAAHDPVTALANRSLLQEHVGRALANYQRTGAGFAVMVIDLDGLKLVQDNRGLAAADIVLAEAARRLADSIRADDLVARLGDTTFVATLPGATAPRALCRVAERIGAALAEPFGGVGPDVVLRPAIGIALASPVCDSFEHLLAFADAAMHRARTHVGFYEFAATA
jgi:diguanylate cyclase (GGDEF)-like protein